MSSRHLVDPDLLPLLDAFPPQERTLETLPRIRADLDRAVAAQLQAQGVTSGVERTDESIECPESGANIALAVYTPPQAQALAPVYFDIHGGGFIAGSIDMKDGQYRRLAEAVGCVVISVDYRLAPETRYPGQIEDCYAALAWVARNCGTRGWDRSAIALGGDSAGGGLAAALALMARDRGEIGIVQINLNSPMLDDRPGTPSPFVGEFIWGEADNRFGWNCLLGDMPDEEVPAYAAPARATSLEGFPPTFMAVGGLDLFLEQDLAFAGRLALAGVPLELHVYPGAFHGFQVAPGAAVAERYLDDHYAALRAAFAKAGA